MLPTPTIQIPPDARLSVSLELTAQHWIEVMNILSNGPYRIVMPVIDEIQKQCTDQAKVPREGRIMASVDGNNHDA